MNPEKPQIEATSEASEFRGEEVTPYIPARPGSPMLQRLMEIEMPMAVALGRAVLPIHDILRMSSGSLIELDRNAGEYVDLMVHGTVVARGEIVSVKGNYGVRIKEIMSRQDRLALKGVS